MLGGNLLGLKPSQKKALEKLFPRRTAPAAMVSPELAKQLAWISADIRRQVGVLINRRGHVDAVFVGDAKRIYLPDVGRARAGVGHLRGLRHVHTVLDDSGLHRDDLVDLQKLHLDLVCALHIDADGSLVSLHYAYLRATATHGGNIEAQRGSLTEALEVDVEDLIAALEKAFSQTDSLRQTSTKGKALLVGVYAKRQDATWRMEELTELAHTAGLSVADTMIQLRPTPDSHYVLGRGKLEEAVLRCLDTGAELMIVDHDISPAQARAIAAFSELKVIDRTQLILDIFAQHAKSRDGKLQVELAQLKYTLPRLTDMDAGLSRLTGGIGGRGPGETKLEINRRRARERINRLEKEIELLSRRRELRRQQRQQSHLPVIALIGYTNAGKSTLLNALTQSDIGVANQLFSTLDTTSRRLRFPNGIREKQAIITDTVGFIRDLPQDLLKAFRATLEELESADLLVHVLDAADPRLAQKLETVEALLRDLELEGLPSIRVLNKCEVLEAFEAKALAQKHAAMPISAELKQGLDTLVGRLGTALAPGTK